jgi:outer membrane protein assembly factor BamE (lipoprotein component of BamABCDE complex)
MKTQPPQQNRRQKPQTISESFLRTAAAVASVFLVASCATTTAPTASTNKTKPKTTTSKSEPTGGDIRVGMSKAQVLQAWGEPSGKDVTGSGEVWVYGNQNMLRMIPYAGPFLNVNTSKVLFKNGRVADFRNTNSGSAWSQMEGMGGSRFSTW